MADKVIRDILVADATVTSLVSDRISPLIKQQGVTPPAITILRADLSPTMHLTGDALLDINKVHVDCWAESYVEARNIATAVRAALIAQNIQLQNEFDNYEPGIDPGLYNVSQEYLVFI